MPINATDATTNAFTTPARPVADPLETISQLPKDGLPSLGTPYQEVLDAVHRLEKAIEGLRPPVTKVDPTTNFWTTYKKVAGEHDNDMVSKYVGDLDTSMLFAGLFSAVTTAFIVQIIPSLQPNPSDVTNALLLRILQQDASFDGSDPLKPTSNIPISLFRTQSILFASLSTTLLVAFVAALGKQWILYYARVTKWGNTDDQGKERQVRYAGLQKWGLPMVMEALPVMLQFSLLLFGIALVVYLWDLDVSASGVVLVVTCFGSAFYGFIAAVATIWIDCPFQTPLSVLLPKVFLWTRELPALTRDWLGGIGAEAHLPLSLWMKRYDYGASGDSISSDRSMTLTNPAFWRDSPLFTPVPKDIEASAGFWLLENSTEFSATTAVAGVFPEFQWPSHQRSPTALIRFRNAYVECFRAPEFDEPTRSKALQSAAAYYVLYHTQLIWSISKNLDVEVEELLSDFPPDLFLYEHSKEWGGDDLFEYLLRINERSEPVASARFLSYIAPYWFCGDSDSAIRFRSSGLQTLHKLITVLEDWQALVPATITECVLCVGAAMDFPLHPEDLVRVDKSDYLQLTFKMVVEHVHRTVLAGTGRREHCSRTALEVLLHLAKTMPPLVDVAWIDELLWSAVEGNIDHDVFILFLRLRALTGEEDDAGDAKSQVSQDFVHFQGHETDFHSPGGASPPTNTIPAHILLSAISRAIKTCSDREGGWGDEAVYGGLIAIRDIGRLGACLPEVSFLEMLAEAMEKNKPSSVRKAAYDVIQAAQDGWLRSVDLRQTLKDLDFPRRLHSVVTETGRSDHQLSFPEMMEILSEDVYWHPYLRGAVGIWLDFRYEGPYQAIQILLRVAQIPPPEDDNDLPLDNFLVKIVEDEWARFPGRTAKDLSADLLGPFAEVTIQLKESLFTESDREAVLAVVERVIPSLEKRCDDSYEGPGKDICDMIDDLLRVLRVPRSLARSRRSSFL